MVDFKLLNFFKKNQKVRHISVLIFLLLVTFPFQENVNEEQ